METYYKPSGKYSPVSFLYLIIVCFTLLPLLGLLYAYALWYIPFIYIHFIFTIGFAALIGFLVIGFCVIRPGKVRNTWIGSLFGLIGGIVALYFHWACWVDLVLNINRHSSSSFGMGSSSISLNEVFNLVMHPSVLFDNIGEIKEEGIWGLSSTTPIKGGFLAFIWFIEGAMVIAGSVMGGRFAAKKPFSEISNSWFEEKDLGPLDYIADKETTVLDLENAKSGVFNNLAKAGNLQESHSLFTIYYSGDGDYYLTIKNKMAETDKKGKVKFKEDEFVEHISISRTLGEMLMEKSAVATAEPQDAKPAQ